MKNKLPRALAGFILLLLSIIPLYHVMIYFVPVLGDSISSYQILRLRSLQILSAPLLALGILLFFDYFSTYPWKKIIALAASFFVLFLAAMALKWANFLGGAGELAAASFAFGILGLVLLAIAIIGLIYGIRIAKIAQTANGDKLLVIKIVIVILILLSPVCIYRSETVAKNIVRVELSDMNIYSDPDASQILLMSRDTRLISFDVEKNSSTVVIDSSQIFDSPDFFDQHPTFSPVIETAQYRWDQSFIADKATGKRFQFPEDNMRNCQFFLEGKYSACFKYAGKEYGDIELVIMPTTEVVAK